MTEKFPIKGIIVTAASTGINLALGVLYAWSLFKVAIKQSIDAGGPGAFHWDLASLNDPYATCCIVFAVAMIFAGKCQDHYGPRVTAMIGGLLVGAGFIWISQTTSYLGWLFGFGLLVGIGMAFGYAPSTPAAIKWYPPNKIGRISGLVVAGFGLATVYIAPLTKYWLMTVGMQKTMLYLGLAFMVVVCSLSFLLFSPPEGYRPPGFVERRGRNSGKYRELFQTKEYTPMEVLKTPVFWLLWSIYFIGAGAGLMVIGNVAGMAKASLGEKAFLAVVLLACGNAFGRMLAGFLSDKIGRKKTLGIMFTLQSVLMFATIPFAVNQLHNPYLLVVLAALIGLNYGSNLAVFPPLARDLWGMKNLGMNYGILFTAWGAGGLVMSRVSQYLMVRTGSFKSSLICAGVMLFIGCWLLLLFRDRKEELRLQIIKENKQKQQEAIEKEEPVEAVA